MDLRVLVQADLSQKRAQNALWLGDAKVTCFVVLKSSFVYDRNSCSPAEVEGIHVLKGKRPFQPIRAAYHVTYQIHWKETTKKQSSQFVCLRSETWRSIHLHCQFFKLPLTKIYNEKNLMNLRHRPYAPR